MISKNSTATNKSGPTRAIIGWREIVSLPDLKMNYLKAKIDTGARTTALHASNISEFKIDGKLWVKFFPDHDELKSSVVCKAPVMHIRNITNTGGIPEERYIIATRLCIGELDRRIEISLTDRSGMKYPVILGRTALHLFRVNVNPSRSWLLSKKHVARSEDTT